jgi:hypothetical protein
MLSFYNFNEILKAAGINGKVETWSSTVNHAYHGQLISKGNSIRVGEKAMSFNCKWANNPNRTHLPLEVILWLKNECNINVHNIDKETLEVLDSQGTADQLPMNFSYEDVAKQLELDLVKN